MTSSSDSPGSAAAASRGAGFFDADLMARIARMELTARRMVDGFLSGRNQSSRHGFSVEFVEHREYSPGDDLRHLDWKVLGRMDRYYIKRYEEETNITAVLLLDASASMAYGSAGTTKFETCAFLASALAHLLHLQRDAVGLVLFDDGVRAQSPASAKRASVAGITSRLLGAEPRGKTDFHEVLRRTLHDLPGRALHLILSDCFAPLDSLASGLKLLEHHGHDAIVLQVLDPAELTFPFRANTLFRGLEDRRELLTEPHRLRRRYLEALEAFQTSLRQTATASAFDYQLFTAGGDLGPVLAGLLAARSRRTLRVLRRGRI